MGFCGALAAFYCHAAPAKVSALTNVSDIVRLGNDAAARSLPVRLRGVLTYADADWRNGFFQDTSGGIYIDLTQTNARAGQWVDLKGWTERGGFKPLVHSSAIRVLGMTNFPAPARVDLSALASGAFDACWVQMQGVVRRVTLLWGHVQITLMTSLGEFDLDMSGFSGKPAPDYLIDALVRVRGACGLDLNARRQISGVTLHVPGLDQLKVLEAAPSDPFSVSSLPIRSVGTFDPNRLLGRRIKVVGTVTMLMPGRGFYIQDPTGGIRVFTRQTISPRPGDVIEALGFPAIGQFSPCLQDAVFRAVRHGQLPPPIPTTARQLLLQETNDALYVELEARLLRNVPRSADPNLILQQGPTVFTAQSGGQDGSPLFSPLAAGSLLRLRGICSIHGNDRHEPEAVQLLLAGPGAITVLQRASWWTPPRLITAVGGLALTILAALAWVVLLRKEIQLKTQVIEGEHRELLESSRLAGMAEVATSVLHNVGNVLNSVNVSSDLISERLRKSKLGHVRQLADLLLEHKTDLSQFLTQDPRGRHAPRFMDQLATRLSEEHGMLSEEVALLRARIGHIKEIVAMQQTYSKAAGQAEKVKLNVLVEDALRINAAGLDRHEVRVLRDYDPLAPEVSIQRHKAMQVLVNLISNAKYACSESASPDRWIKVSIGAGNGAVQIAVADNGAGIAAESLPHIFSFGFTTRKDGHGFGLHSAALAAQEMGGSLRVRSDGPAKGATFTLELPVPHSNSNSEHQ